MNSFWHRIFSKNHIILYIFILTGISMLFFIQLNQDCEGGDENIFMFMRAKYSIRHLPVLFDDPIKLLFVTLMSIPAQAGIQAMQLVNLILALSTGWMCLKISQQIGLKQQWLLMILILYCPIYYIMSLSALTEVMFSAVLVLSILLLYKQRLNEAAIIMSFAPFIRSEGFVLILVFIVYYMIQKKYIPILLLSIGTILISILGYSIHQDILWVFNNNYGDASAFYGHGEWYHFLKYSRWYYGPFLTLILPISFIVLFIQLKKLYIHEQILLLVIAGCFYGFFLLHSILWWKGLGASLGLTRVMACTAPLGAILVVWTLQYFEKYYIKYSNLVYLIIASGSVGYCFKSNKLPLSLDTEHTVGNEFFEKSKPYIAKAPEIRFNSYYFAYLSNIDPFDSVSYGDCKTVNEARLKDMKPGSIIQYETHFGPNECRVPIDFYDKRDDFEKVVDVKPTVPFKVLGGYDYRMMLYRKK